MNIDIALEQEGKIKNENTLSDDFEYAKVNDFLSSELAGVCYEYAQLQIKKGVYEEFLVDGSKKKGCRGRTRGCYADALMETLLKRSTAQMEELTQTQLWPTYSYIREYYQGADLAAHYDRPSSEYVATVTLGYDYSNVSDEDYQWFMGVSGQEFALPVGSALVFKGGEQPHWRDQFLGKSHCQLVLSWVAKQSDWAQYCKFDGRPWLGAPANVRYPALYKKYQEKLRQRRLALGFHDE